MTGLLHGFSSMFAFSVERYGMSESTASKRIGACRLGRRFPGVFEGVAEGALHLSGLSVLAAHLTEENHRAVLVRARGMTRRQIEQRRTSALVSVRRRVGDRVTRDNACAS